jgi:hypothetical protein
MKKLTIIGIIGFGLFATQITEAQGTLTYLSNLGQTSTGNNPVGSNSWLAAGFFTGTNVNGYILNSVQLGMADASGSPSGFTVMLYSAISGLGTNPGNNLDTLNGSLSPVSGGIFTYTSTDNLTLSPNTEYFIVLTAGTAVANGAYEWNFMNTSSYNPVDNWLATVTLSSNNGSSSWTRLGTNPNFDYSGFALNAIPAPEPSPSWLLLLGSGIFIYVRRTFQRHNKTS